MAEQIAKYILYIALALIPSFLWLFWYLRKDKHPEPKAMIISVFIWGMLVAFPAVIVENFSNEIIKSFSLPNIISMPLLYFIAVSVTEEVLKFLVVYFRILKRTTELDEPIDAVIYMIVSALGFAAIENVFLLTPLFQDNFATALNVAITRFIGATFLHTLASATVGYYLALSMYKPAQKFPLLIHGFALAILLHGFYNIFVLQVEDNFLFVFPTSILIFVTAIAISSFIKKLSKMKSITMPQN